MPVELEEENDGYCAMCYKRNIPSKWIRFTTVNDTSVISFSICNDCLKKLSKQLNELVDNLE